MLDKELQLLQDNPNTLSLYLSGINDLYKSGVFNFLRSLGRVTLSPKDTAEEVSLHGAYAAGCQDILDFLFNFEEQFLKKRNIGPIVKADFGGRMMLLKRGDITKEESDELGKSK